MAKVHVDIYFAQQGLSLVGGFLAAILAQQGRFWLGFGDCSGRDWSGQPQHRHQRRFGGVGAAETTSYVAEMSLGRLFQGTVALDQCLRTKRRIRNVPETS